MNIGFIELRRTPALREHIQSPHFSGLDALPSGCFRVKADPGITHDRGITHEFTIPPIPRCQFHSHDTNLLAGTAEEWLLGRDQAWFTQKLKSGATQLYPLTRFKPRKHEAITKRYLNGWYGANPILTPHDFNIAIQNATTGSS